MIEERPNQYIDAEASHDFQQKTDWESLIIFQFKKCMENLSKEEAGGYLKTNTSKTGIAQEQYVEDTRIAIINSVSTLQSLLIMWIEGNRKTEIENLLEQITIYRNNLKEQKIMIRGQGVVNVGDIQRFNVEHPLFQKFVQYKCQIYRELFTQLVMVYQEHKSEIQSYENE